MKVYVIERGDYSDRHIVGVFESREEARNICKRLTPEPDESISCVEYDTNQFSANRMRFIVDKFLGEWDANHDDYDLYNMYTENVCDYEDHYVIYANSANQAIKIAQDMEAQIRAEKEGIC